MTEATLTSIRDEKEQNAARTRRSIDYWLRVVIIAYPALLRLAADGNPDALAAVAKIQLLPKHDS